jgi:hypothetical protein
MSYCVQPRSNYRSRESGDKLADVEFIDENGGGQGVRLPNRQRQKTVQIIGRTVALILRNEANLPAGR